MKARRLRSLQSALLLGTFVSGLFLGKYSNNLEPKIAYTGSFLHERSYESKKFGILISDMETDYWVKVDTDEQENEFPNYLEIIDYAASNDIPVAVMTDPKSVPMAELAVRLQKVPRVHRIVTNKNSAFNGTDLDAWFKKQGVGTIFLTGLYSTVCVFDSANDALKSGFKIATAGNAMSDGIKMREFDDRKYGKDSPYHEERLWYRANGMYSDDFRDVLAIMK